MPFGYPPFVRDYLDTLIERRLGRKPLPPDSVLGADAMTPYEAPGYPVGLDTPVSPRRPSILRQGLAAGLSDIGLQSFGSGVGAGLQQQGFLPALAASFGASVGAGGRLRAAEAGGKSKSDLEERRVRAAERQAKAAEDRANRSPAASGHQSRYEVLSDEARFLGEQGVNTKDYYGKHGLARGAGGSGAGGRLTDLDKVAQGLVDTKRAPDLSSAYVMARTLTQQPQVVGSITRTTADPNNVFNMTTTRVSVARRINPITGDFELIDEQGNLVTDKDMSTFRSAPTDFSGGTGGPAAAPPPAPAPAGGIPLVPSHTPAAAAPVPGAAPAALPPAAPQAAAGAPGSDFQTSVQGVTEDQIIQALVSPGVDPNLVRLYAAGRGPMGNSTRIKQAAGQALAQGR